MLKLGTFNNNCFSLPLVVHLLNNRKIINITVMVTEDVEAFSLEQEI